MRKVSVIVGIILCAIGIIFTPSWLIAVGVIAIIASSFLPDTPIPYLDQLTANSDAEGGIKWPVYRWLALAGTVFVLGAVGATNNDFNAIWPLPVWIIGVGLLIAAAISHDRSAGANQSIQEKWHRFKSGGYRQPEFIAVVALTIIAAVLRTIQLDALPPMHGDEGEMGIRAMRVINDDQFLAPFSTDFLDHPNLFHYLQALSIQIFGPTISGLRAVSVLFGVLCIPAVYLAGSISYSKLVGLIAAGFLTFSHIHIHFSRLGLNNIHSVLMAILLFILVLWCQRAIQNEQSASAVTPWFAAGLVAGLAQYFYFGSRLLPFVLVIWLAIIWYRARHTAGWSLWRKLALVPLGFLAGWLPLVPQYIRVPSTFVSRQTGVSAFNSRNLAAILGEDPTTFEVLSYQVQRNVRFFIDSGDVSSFYFSGAPGLGTVAAILFWVGFAFALARITRFPNGLIVGWFVLGVALGGVLTNTAPAATRLVMVYPAIALLCGLAAETIFSLLQNQSSPNRWLQLVTAAACIGMMAVFGVQTYFETYAADPPQSHMVKIGNQFATHSADSDTFLMGEPIIFVRHGTILYTNQKDLPRDLNSFDQFEEMPLTKPNLFFVTVPPKLDELNRVQESMPGGDLQEITAPNGRVMFYTYKVAAPKN